MARSAFQIGWLCLVALDAVGGVEPIAINREEILKSIERHFPAIRTAVLDLEKSEADLLNAQGGFDPVLNAQIRSTPTGEYQYQTADIRLLQPTPLYGAQLFAGYRLGSGNIPSYDGNLATNSAGEWRAGIELPLLQGGWTDRRRTSIEIHRLGVDVASASLAMQRIEVRRSALTRYMEWLMALGRLRIAKDLLQLAENRENAMQQRVHRGDAAKMDHTDNLRLVVQRRAILISAQRSVQKSALELSLFFRDESGMPVIPLEESGTMQELDLPEAPSLEEVGSAHVEFAGFPELVRLEKQTEALIWERRLAQINILPKLNALAEYAQDLGTGSASRALPEFRIGLGLEFPLLFRSSRGQLRAIEQQVSKVEIQRGFAQQKMQVGLQDAAQSMDAARKRVVEAKAEVLLSQEVEAGERLRLKHGDSNIFLVNQRELATAEARQRLVEAQFEYQKAQIDYAALNSRME